MASKASAVWTGSLKEGKGTISTATGVLSNANYSFQTRFEGADSGTTPEELIAAAHASCFSMALGAQLERWVVAGCVFKDMRLKPSVLDQFSGERAVEPPAPRCRWAYSAHRGSTPPAPWPAYGRSSAPGPTGLAA